MLYRRRLHIHICISAPAGMGGVSPRQASRLRYGIGILVSMVVRKLGNGALLCEAAEGTSEFHHTRSILCCLFRHYTLTEGMKLGIYSDIAAAAAHRPVLICVMLDDAGFACAMAAFAAVMIFPFCAFGTNIMFASQICCRFCTAVLAQLAVGTDGNTVFTFHAFFTNVRTICAVFTAIDADVIHTVTAIITVTAHHIGTVDADAAVGAIFVNATRTLAAFFADIFHAVGANGTAVLTHLHTVAALIAVLAENIIRAFTTNIAGGAELVCAVGAFITAIRTQIRTVFATLTAGTYHSAIRA